MLAPLLAAQVVFVFLLWRLLRPRFSAIAKAVFWVAVVSLFGLGLAGIFLGIVRESAAWYRDVRTVAYLWLLASAPALVIYGIYRFVEARLQVETDRNRRGLLRIAGVAAVAAPFAVEGWGAFVTRFNYKVEEVNLPIVGLHPDLEGLKILQLSDIHLSRFLSVRELARVIDASNELRPQVALMTGDLISSWGDPLDDCIAQLSRIKADSPMLGCLGNHEIYAQVERYTEVQAARKGMVFLRHERRGLQFGKGVLNVAGIDYQPFTLRGQYLRGAQNLIIPNATNMLLSHNPDVFTEAPEQGWQAMVAGHTHGGQVTLEILKQTVNPARFLTPYVSGLYVERGATCYVTRGIGTIGIPARVGATPEITLLRLRKA